MCFKNLPVQFDDHGRASLKEGVANPWSIDGAAKPKGFTKTKTARVAGGAVATEPQVRDWMIDPITRVAGALAIHIQLDLEKRESIECHSMAMLFRGYELILEGRDPRDSIDLTSRACGVCGGTHATCSSQCMDMAFGVRPPPMGVLARNLGELAEMLYDAPIHMGLLAGPDYSTPLVEVTNPEIVRKAETTLAPNSGLHGYETIKDIMDAMAPLSGKIYLEAIHMTRLGREMVNLFYGKFPHPSTLVPGGVTTTITTSTFNEYNSRLMGFLDYAKRVQGWWNDVLDFFLECNPRYTEVGDRPINIIQPGAWDDPEAYDGTFANLDTWGNLRRSTPGVVIDGKLVTTNLTQIDAGIEEFVQHSFYEEWTAEQQRYQTDPNGNPISPYHAWNKITIPKPGARDFKEKYTWDTAPRWDRQVVETGVYGRMWTTALAQKAPPSDFVESTGDGLRMLLPKGELPEMELFWKVPDRLNAFERTRARSFSVAWQAANALTVLLQAYDYWRRGETKAYQKFTVPKDERRGAGFWEAGRGWLSHHMTIDKGRIVNYQINTPSTLNASPRDPWGVPGPYEQASIGTPLLETTAEDNLKGIDVLRTIRSFDPCMPCTTHIDTGRGVISREVNSCSCTLE
ncbi:MAG TPA: nickel-dependent hydrogenase large subunit [Egibacteraceae bacterium]|nr:nickel-dependent hydrogenase large subunit [Egibacteraceae bacterium]